MSRIVLIIAAVVVLLLGAAFAWQWFGLIRLATVMDYNRNGALELEEVGPSMKLRFAEIDADGDGHIRRRELLPYLFDSTRRALRVRMRTRGLPGKDMPASVSAADIDRALAQMVEVLDLPGAALIVGLAGRETYRGSAGEIGVQTRVPVASASKWVSAAVIMKLVEAQRLDLDRPLADYLPDLPAHWRKVTPRQLLSFTAGVAEGHAFEASPETPNRKVYEQLAQKPLHGAPGAEFTYGGITLQIAGHLAEQVGGLSWNELFTSQVAAPAGMTASFYGHPLWHRDGAVQSSPNVAAGLHTTAEDYFRFLTALLPTDSGAAPLLSPASIQEMETDYTRGLPQNFRPPAVLPDWSYGLGLWCERRRERQCLTVSSAGAYGTFPWIDRETGSYGVLVTVGQIRPVMPFALHLRALAERLR